MLRVEESPAPARRLLRARDVASVLNVSLTYVYEHAEELGAIRVGGGPKARLRFRPDVVDQVLADWNREPPTAA